MQHQLQRHPEEYRHRNSVHTLNSGREDFVALYSFPSRGVACYVEVPTSQDENALLIRASASTLLGLKHQTCGLGTASSCILAHRA
jgi:hypothetical protein